MSTRLLRKLAAAKKNLERFSTISQMESQVMESRAAFPGLPDCRGAD